MGETITITRRGKPMARLVPVDVEATAPHVATFRAGWKTMTPFLLQWTPLWQTGRRICRARSATQIWTNMYLLDTNARSELLKERPKPEFLARLPLPGGRG